MISLKSEEDFNFKMVGSFDIEEIKKTVIGFKSEWMIDQTRQNMIYDDRRNPHLYTETYVVQDHSLFWLEGSNFNPVRKNEAILNKLSKIIHDLEYLVVGKAARVLLINLQAGKNVTTHVDSGDYLNAVRRFHIPIITNSDVYYTVNGEKINMNEGDCWEINNLKPHSVDNNSEHDRVHLLVDIMPEYKFRTIDKISKDSKIKLIENFISEEDAEIFLQHIKMNYLNPDMFTPGKGVAAKGRVRYEANIPENNNLSSHKSMLNLINKYSEKFISECKLFFGDGDNLNVTAFWMTMLGKDTQLPAHNDNHPGAEHLYRSGVIYLNEDFEGGHLKFYDHNLTYKPKKYSIVIFDSPYIHEIKQVTKGVRFAIPIWATIEEGKNLF